jgi:hypothetical protein
VRGKTIGEWSAKWWQWAVSSSVPNDPFTDTTGANANLHQSGPVFFMAGTAGTSESRSFSIPGNKAILIPLLVGELSQAEIGFDKTEDEVRQAAADQADLIDELHCTVDGVPIGDLFSHREVSPAFSFEAAVDNAIGVPAGDSGTAVADGYWVMLEPLGPGEHTLHFGGGISSFGYSVAVAADVQITSGYTRGNVCIFSDVSMAELVLS